MDYVEAFKNLRTNNKYGRKSPHKAVLMLTVIELYEQSILTDNEIYYDDSLKSMFLKVWNKVLPKEPLFHPDAYLPFWYLQSDSFWHIIPIRGKEDILSLMRDANIKPSEAKLIDSVNYAELDDDLYFLMTITSGRSSLKRALLETYTQLSEYQIAKMAESADNVVDHSLSALDEYEQMLSSKNNDDNTFDDGSSAELEKQFRKLSDDLQIALNYEYFAFLKKHRSERDMLREVCPNVYVLYDCIINHPIQQADISPSFTFIYDNFLCDLKIALMSEDGSMELIDKIETAIEILRGNDVADDTLEEEETIDVNDVIEEQEGSAEKQIVDSTKNQNDFKIENSYTRCYIVNTNGERVYSSSGKLIIIGDEFYRINYTDSVFSMYLISNDNNGDYFKEKRILNARHRSPLFDALDKYEYVDQIKDVRIDHNTEECHVKVEERWYGSSGYYADLDPEINQSPINNVTVGAYEANTNNDVEETTVDNTYSSIDESEIEHVYLDHKGKIAKIVPPAPKENAPIENQSESRKGKIWTEEEEERITLYFERGISTADIAERVGRSEVAIKMRLAKLGLIEYTYGQDEADNTTFNAESFNPNDFKIENNSRSCYIYKKGGEKIFKDDGKLKVIRGKLYRLNLKNECFTIKDMLFNGEVWMKGNKKIVAYPMSRLYKAVDGAYDYYKSFEDIVDASSFDECKLKFNGIWYDNLGNMTEEPHLRNTVTEELPKQHHDYLKIIKHPLYAVRKQALLRAMGFFRLPAKIRDITRTISRTAWGEAIKEDDVEEIINTLNEVESVEDNKYILRKK